MRCLLLVLAVGAVALAQGPSRVARRVLGADAAGRERAVNRGFEEPGGPLGAASWEAWDRGFQVVPEGRTGRAARCVATDPEQQAGALQRVVLNQTAPLPVVAGGWSRAQGVDGSPDSGYSVYVDITYTDGSNLWGQVAPFAVGTHDWQQRRVVLDSAKPIRELTIYGLFRNHRGTVWFDDFSLRELELPAGAQRFDGVTVERAGPVAFPADGDVLTLPVDRASPLRIDRATGAMALADGDAGGLLVRDVAAESNFLQPVLTAEPAGDGVRLSGACPELQLALGAELKPTDGALRLSGRVTDTRGGDRAVTVTWALPVDLVGGRWPDDVRASRPIVAGEYHEQFQCGAGATGAMSRYPIAAPYTEQLGVALGYPLSAPRLVRCGYNADDRTLYASVDLGLSAATTKSPSSASFELVLYGFDPAWGFRAAWAEYHRLFPELFAKRVEREGIWMPFTDIATVERHESFGFQFKEGDDNVAFDDAAGITTFVYIEPMSYWMGMERDVPRTYEAALAQLRTEAASEGPRQSNARATLSSAVQPGRDGPLSCALIVAPWSDGAVFHNNPDPEIPGGEYDWNQGRHLRAFIDRAFARQARPAVSSWTNYGEGFTPQVDGGRGGPGIRVVGTGGDGAGARQVVEIEQTQPKPITASLWYRTENLTGEVGADCSLYIDAQYADGESLFGQIAPLAMGTNDWRRAEVTIQPDRPIRTLSVHLLVRGAHRGTVWFDGVELREEGGENLIRNGGFGADTLAAQAVLDGVYIDSYEMAASTANYRAEQFAAMDEPLVFDLADRAVCAQVQQHTWEFCRQLSNDLHAAGRLFMANAVLGSYASAAPLFDVLGIETDWAPRERYEPNDDRTMNFRRALCYQKPYCILQNTDYAKFRPEWVDLYFQRCLFYGIHPSFFSHNAADDPYWQNPRLYNRDRPLFERVIPVVRQVAAAGWEPVTLARCDDATIWIERFGRPGGELYLTIFGSSEQAAAGVLTLDEALPAGEWETVFAGRGCSLSGEGRSRRVTLGPQQVLVVRAR